MVEHLQGSAQAKQRLRVVLETLTGSRRVQEACQELGIGEVRFNQLRLEALEGALAALECKPKGRPPRAAAPASAAELEQLAEMVESLKIQLQTSQVREEIALAGVRPRTGSAAPGKKTTARPSRPR
jgi:transposase-like protein